MDNKVNINIENSIKVLKLMYENILKMFNEIDQIVSKKNCFGIKIRENSGNLEVKEVKDLIKTRFIYAYVNPRYNVDKNEDIQDFEKNHISYLKDEAHIKNLNKIKQLNIIEIVLDDEKVNKPTIYYGVIKYYKIEDEIGKGTSDTVSIYKNIDEAVRTEKLRTKLETKKRNHNI